MTYHNIISRLLLAFIISAIIGLDREGKNSPAGLRTHILVGIASCLVMLNDIYMFEYYLNTYGTPIQATRLASSVLASVGVLCVGNVIKYGNNIKGLTTAVSLWSVSGIGLACGSGFYSGAITAGVIMLVVLLILRIFEEDYKSNKCTNTLEVVLNNDVIKLSDIFDLLEVYSIKVKRIKTIEGKNNKLMNKVYIVLPDDFDNKAFLEKLSSISGVYEARII